MQRSEVIILIIFWLVSLSPVFLAPIFLILLSIVLTGLVIWKTIAIKKEKRKWKIYLLLSPPIALSIIGFLTGTIGYITGHATFVFNNKHNVIRLDSYQNFDHDYRVYYPDFRGKHYGPISGINLSYMYRGRINDYTIKLLTNAFGYQFGMYQGKIPSPGEMYEAFESDSLYIIKLTDASINHASFTFNDHEYRIRATAKSDEDIESPIMCYPGALTDARIKQKDGTYLIGEKILDERATFVASMKYYPLMIVTESIYVNRDGCTVIQLIDLEREIRFAHYSIKNGKIYPCTFCYCW